MECWSGGVLVKSPAFAVGLPAFGGATGDQGCDAAHSRMQSRVDRSERERTWDRAYRAVRFYGRKSAVSSQLDKEGGHLAFLPFARAPRLRSQLSVAPGSGLVF
jgi:hypothetical protein